MTESFRNSALQVYEPDEDSLYDLDTAAHLAGAPRRSVAVYCRWGMVRPEVDETYGGWYFDAEAIQAVRRIEYLRRVQGVNLAGIRMIMALLSRLEQTGPTAGSSWSATL
jgi:DNA-binding transcriptional MerR regulator